MSKEQIAELIAAKEFIDTFSGDPRLKGMLAQLKAAIALDRQEAKMAFAVVRD